MARAFRRFHAALRDDGRLVIVFALSNDCRTLLAPSRTP